MPSMINFCCTYCIACFDELSLTTVPPGVGVTLTGSVGVGVGLRETVYWSSQ